MKTNNSNSLDNLKKGTTFDYEGKIWKITEVYKIKWDDGTKSTEYQVKTNRHVGFLEVHLDAEKNLNYSFWRKETNKNHFLSIIKNTTSDFVELGSAKFPKKINYKKVSYTFKAICDGTCSYGYESERVNSLDYTNENNTKLLSIELWDDEIEISTGIYITRADISNIQESKSYTSGINSSSIIETLAKYSSGIFITLFFLITFLCNRCSSSWNGNRDPNDSTKVYRNSGSSRGTYYRGRSSGFGK